MPLKPIKIKYRIESLIQDIKQADYAFDTFDAYYLALRLNDLYKNNKKVKKYLLELEKVIMKEPESAICMLQTYSIEPGQRLNLIS